MPFGRKIKLDGVKRVYVRVGRKSRENKRKKIKTRGL
jgi:hypothetical protein